MPPHKSIKDWADDDKPREKMLSKGRQNLSDSELLAILIGSGTPGISAVDLSKLILNDYNNNLNELGKAEINDFVKKYKGIGTAKAITIVAALELGRRRQHTTPLERIAITSSKDVFNYLYGTMADLPHEEFWILLCNRSNKVMDKIQIGQGGLSSVVVDTKIIIRHALERLASAIILCHNHPSGNLKPSNEDINLTKRVKEAAALLDFRILDHIIIGDMNYYSFADEGML